jgi:hypothetical protein
MARKILSIIAGYALFVVSSLLLFNLTGQNPHKEASISFQILTAIYGIAFAFLSGLVVQRIAETNNLKLNYILTFIIAGFAAFSLFKATGNHWTQLLAIALFAPASLLGGLFYIRRNKK